MRSEQDSLGEIQLFENDYFGIGTARICGVVKSLGPCFPKRLIVNIVRVRQAQAQELGKTGAWSGLLSKSVVDAGEKFITPEFGGMGQVVIRAMHGGGAKCLVTNIDEVLANIALELQHHHKGEYHRVAPLFQLDCGFCNQNVFHIALHISLVQEIDLMLSKLQMCINVLQQQADRFQTQKTLLRQNFQAIKISDMGAEFSCFAESLSRTGQMLKWYRTELLPIWCNSQGLADNLSLLTGVDLVQDLGRSEGQNCLDLYCGTSSLLKTAALSMLQLCNNLRFHTSVTKELEAPKLCTGYVFNPSTQDMLIPDTVSQIAFQIIGNDASITAAINAGTNGVLTYLPMVSAHLLGSAQLFAMALNLLGQEYLSQINGKAIVSEQLLEATPLQAEKLIPLLGYERAVQVARIAALTEKPVRLVVERMKLLTEQQAEALFAVHNNRSEENDC
jgi:aspartate ammonia-lyase